MGETMRTTERTPRSTQYPAFCRRRTVYSHDLWRWNGRDLLRNLEVPS